MTEHQSKLSDAELVVSVIELREERDAMARKAMDLQRQNLVMRGQCQGYQKALEIMSKGAFR